MNHKQIRQPDLLIIDGNQAAFYNCVTVKMSADIFFNKVSCFDFGFRKLSFSVKLLKGSFFVISEKIRKMS